MQTFLSPGSVATAIGLVITVWAWKMNASSANWMLVLAWGLFSLSIYSSVPGITKLPVVPRSLVTMLCASLTGLTLYRMLWTPQPQGDAATAAQAGTRDTGPFSAKVDAIDSGYIPT